FLPDKAIDLLDEAASRLRIENDSMPAELDEVRRRLMQLEIEREALKLEKDPESKKRLAALEQEVAEVSERNRGLPAQWEVEKGELEQTKKLRSAIEAKHVELDQAKRRGDFETASRIQYGELRDFETKLAAAEAVLAKRRASGSTMIKEEVDPEQVAE